MTRPDRRSALKAGVKAVSIPLVAAIIGLLVGTLFMLAAGRDPILAYTALFEAVAGDAKSFGETLVSSIPLMLTGLAVALAFRCGLFNIGAEGQYMLGQVATAWAASALVLPGWLHPAASMAVGAAAGAAWAAIPGLLKAYRGVHEVINSIMLNYAGLFFSQWLLIAFLKAPGGTASSRPAAPTALLTQGLIEGSRLHAGLWVALSAAVLIWVYLFLTPGGYEIRAVGLSPGAAEYAGIAVPGSIVRAMALSGALAGLAGAVQLLGVSVGGRFYEPHGFAGYGFDGIAVALVGRSHPLGVVLSALLFGSLDRGGPRMQAIANVPKAVIWIVQGTVIFFVAAEGMWRFQRNRRIRAEVKSS